MSVQPFTQAVGTATNGAVKTATIRFRRDQRSSGVSRVGSLQARGRVRIEYDRARLVSDHDAEATAEIVGHLRFEPSGEVQSSPLLPVATYGSVTPGRLLFLETDVPAGTSAMEVWFERRGPRGTSGWDSRYGQNFRFPVAEQGLPIPEPSVALRPATRLDPGRVQVVEDAASKGQAPMGSTGSALQTALSIRARIAAAPAVDAVWADVHVFDATGELIHSGTVPLHERQPLEGNTTMVAWSAEIYQGSGGGSGLGVWSRPDAHLVQYRLYCQIGEEVLTDGVLHEFDVPPDAEVRPIPGGW